MQYEKCFNCMNSLDIAVSNVCPYCGYYQLEQMEDPANKSALPPGTILAGKYYLGKVLGIGGFAITYVAYNYALQCKVAIKEYFPSGRAERAADGFRVLSGTGDDEEQFRMGLEQFASESHRLAKVGTHQGIVSIFESFYENGTAYIAMEYVDGESLEKVLLTRGAPMEPTGLIKIIMPICVALDNIHKNERIIHRDIAPDNIMLQPNGKAKLIDFGASLDTYAENKHLILKHGYAPAEQYDEKAVCTPKTDVYAMCAVLYHMLSGRRPVRSDERKTALESGRPDPLPPLIEAAPGIPMKLSVIVMKGLSVYPGDRFAELGELVRLLSEYIPGFVPPPEPPPPKKNPLRIIIPVVAGVAVTAAVLLFARFGVDREVDEAVSVGVYPELIGMTAEEAEKYLEDEENVQGAYSFSLVTSEEDIPTNDKKKDGQIARQDKNAGEEISPEDVIKAESKLNIVVSLYKYDPDADNTSDELIEMPELIGKKETDAEKLLKDAEIGYTVVKDYNSYYNYGTVCAQSVEAGSRIIRTETVKLTVSLGKKPVATTKASSPSRTSGSSGKKPTQPSPSKPSPTPSGGFEFDEPSRSSSGGRKSEEKTTGKHTTPSTTKPESGVEFFKKKSKQGDSEALFGIYW